MLAPGICWCHCCDPVKEAGGTWNLQTHFNCMVPGAAMSDAPLKGVRYMFLSKTGPLKNKFCFSEAMLPQQAWKLHCVAHHALLESCMLLLEPLKGLGQPGSIQPQHGHVRDGEDLHRERWNSLQPAGQACLHLAMP